MSEIMPKNDDIFIIPTIDLQDSAAAEKLAVVCQDHGLFYLVGHGIPPERLEALFVQSKALFQLPIDTKAKISDPFLNRGYTALQEQTLDPSNQKEGDTKEGYYIGMDISQDDPRYNPQKLCGPNQWPDPEVLPDFASTLQNYHGTATEIGRKVVCLIAQGLGLAENYFDEDFVNPIATLRLLHYDNRESDPANGIFACGAHKDFGIITLLLTDDTEGLQIYHEDQWRDVPPKTDSFVVNVGDMLEIWTNGRYKSSLHRVLTKKSEHNKDRYSIPFFFEPHFDAKVECLECCSSADNPPKYPPTTCGKFLVSKFQSTHADFDQ